MKDSQVQQVARVDEPTARAARVEWGRVLTSGLLGTAMAACLTIVGAQLEGDLVRRAMYALVASMPLLAMHLLVTAPGWEGRHDVSCLMRLLLLLGVIAATLGLAMLFEHAVAGAGWLLGVLAVLTAGITSAAEDRVRWRQTKGDGNGGREGR